MPTAGLGTFSHLLGAVLIAQMLLATGAAVISKREIAAGGSGATATAPAAGLAAEDAHGPDTVAVVEGALSEELTVDEKIESATRKSTKLLPHSGSNSNSNSNNRADNFRPSGKLVLNRVAEEPLKMEVGVKEIKEDETRVTESSIFSHNAAVGVSVTEPGTLATAAISSNVDNGLDELAAAEQRSEMRMEQSKVQSADTEEVLPELERVALRPVAGSSNDAATLDGATTTTASLMAVRSEASQSNENQLEEAAVKRFEPLPPKLSENHTAAVNAVTDAGIAATHNPLALPELIVSTTTAAPVTTTNSYRDGEPMESVASTPSKTQTPTKPTATTSAQMFMNSAGGESNEIRGSAEKRAKFISDNSTNAQQINLPDAAEVWTLAAMKTVPYANASGSPANGNELVTDTTETALNSSAVYSNSEKNLLDWTQIMMNGAMDNKRLDSLIDRDVTQPPVTDESVAVTLATLGVDKFSENRTELQINSTVDATDAASEHTTPSLVSTESALLPASGFSTHLPQQVNEIGIDMTTAGAGAAADKKSSLEPPHVTSIAGVMPAATTEAADARISATAAQQSAPTPTATLSDNHLSADSADKRSSEELLVTNRTVTEPTTAQPEGSKIESEMAEATTFKSPNPDASVISVKLTTTAPTPTPMPTATATMTTTTSPSAEKPVASTTEPPPPMSVRPASDVLPPARTVNSSGNNNNNINNGDPLDANNDISTNNNNNNNNDSNGSAGAVDVNASASASRDADRVINSGSDSAATLERSSSETTTFSTLAASEPNTTSASVEDSNLTPRVPFSAAHNENRVVWETTTETAAAAATATTPTIKTITTTALPAILVVNSGPNTTTEASQIGNEVELEVSSERSASTAASSSAIKRTHSGADNEDGEHVDSGTTTSSPVDKLLITTTTTTANPPTTTTTTTTNTTANTATLIEELAETSTSIPLQVAIQQTETATTNAPLGSVTVVNSDSKTAAPSTTTAIETETPTAPPTAVAKGKTNANEVSNSASHETETSIETNVIDQLDKTTVKTTTTTTTTTTTPPSPAGETNKKDIAPVESETEANSLGASEDNNDNSLPHETTMAVLTLNATTVASHVPNVIFTSTTTEPPLINLLDDSSTSTTTTKSPMSTTVSSIATKIQEIYSVFSTTTPADSNHTATPTVPPSMTDTTPTPIAVTTMLPAAPTLHATLGATHNLHPNAADANETDVNVIIAITVSVIGVIALILLVAFLYLIRKRQKQMSYGQRCRPVSLDDYSLDNVSVLGSVRRKGALRASKRSYGNIAFDDPSLRHNVLTASELVKFAERRSSIFEEFRDVPQIIARADEVPHGCEDKNRYANVIPLPETRVILQQQLDDEKTEYINANYVRGPKDAPNYYIATQAPLETTVFDFWRMIWEQQSRVIIQATDLIENGIEKCAEYLPPSVTLDNHTTYGDFQITLKHREVKDKYAISTIVLKNTAENVSRELTHYWYKWPEAGVPSEEAPIIAMLLEARSSLKSYANEPKEKSGTLTLTEGSAESSASGNGVTVVAVEPSSERTDADSGSRVEINGNVSTDKLKMSTLRNQGPLTIHCSPGTGRTGTIIACDMAIRSLETPRRSVDIPQIVYYVRRGRASAVQTKEQYEFIYKVAHMYATKITNLSNEN